MRKRSEVEQPTPAGEVVTIPHDVITEQVILAAAIVDTTTGDHLLKRLTPDHFLEPGHRAAWAGLGELRRRRLEYDPAVLQRLAGDVDVGYLGQIVEVRPEVPENLDWHIDNLLWDKARATAVSGPIAALIEAIKNPKEAPERVRALARHVGDAFAGHGAGQFLHEPKELVRTQIQEVLQRIEGHACYPYGIDGLDVFESGALDERGNDLTGRKRILPGAAPGQVTVLTGVPGGGKARRPRAWHSGSRGRNDGCSMQRGRWAAA